MREGSPVPEARELLRPSGRFALATLATWRVTHLLAEEDGPGDAVIRLRARAGESWVGGLMDCFYCLSVWVAAPFALYASRRRREAPLTWLALSGAACLLEQATRERPASTDEKGAPDGMRMWPEATGVQEQWPGAGREAGAEAGSPAG